MMQGLGRCLCAGQPLQLWRAGCVPDAWRPLLSAHGAAGWGHVCWWVHELGACMVVGTSMLVGTHVCWWGRMYVGEVVWFMHLREVDSHVLVRLIEWWACGHLQGSCMPERTGAMCCRGCKLVQSALRPPGAPPAPASCAAMRC